MGQKTITTIGKAICDALGIDAKQTVCLRLILKADALEVIAEQIVVTRQAVDGKQEEGIASVLRAYKLVPIEEGDDDA